MRNKSFKELYELEKRKPTAAALFIDEVASLTHKHPVTVRLWLSGVQQPDELAKSVIAERYGTTIEALFPPKEKKGGRERQQATTDNKTDKGL